MKILIIGGGGREHALAWKLSQSPRVETIYCAPGNGGSIPKARNHPLGASNISELRDFAVEKEIDLTVVGPDDALAEGVVDLFQEAGLRIFGPTKSCARLESSKIFAKEFMERHGIPTAKSGRFTDPDAAREFARRLGNTVVIKADGLALGKGVIIAQNQSESAMAIWRMMERKEFGNAGASVVIEEFLEGVECSLHALIDGKNYLLFPAAQDHKRAFDGDAGPNTGGMGTCSPIPLFDAALETRVRREIMDRFMAGIAAEGLDFRGMLFPGLMVTSDGPKVLEFNCRFGDPETQVLLPRLKSDLLELLEATIDGRLSEASPVWDQRAAVCVILASGGYPGSYKKGCTITGIDAAEKSEALIFHAGTTRENDSIVTSGGRVLGIAALGEDLKIAQTLAYQAVDQIEFAGKFFRHDIGAKSIQD